MSEVKNLAQDNDTMFERNIAIKASKEEEVEITTTTDAFTGFICGLDDNWLQICGRSQELMTQGKDWELILLNRENIVSVHSTGNTSNNLNESIRENVQKKIHTFSIVSKSFLDKKK